MVSFEVRSIQMVLKPPSLAKARDKDEHIGEVSIAPSGTGLREFAREEIGKKAAAGGRHSDPGSAAADFELRKKPETRNEPFETRTDRYFEVPTIVHGGTTFRNSND